jgi:uncharacterized protein
MKSCIPIQSRKKNRYFFDRRQKKTILCHPLLYYFLGLKNQDIEPGNRIEQLKVDPVSIDGLGPFSTEEIDYYYKKYLFLGKNGHFQNFELEVPGSEKLTADEVKKALANTTQILFESTENCGLNCAYCGYGEFYNDYDKRENLKMDTAIAKKMLDFLVELWNSPLNLSHGKTIYIGIYGGEPLTNIRLIKSIISYTSELKLIHNRFAFTITTNGVLLDKYMDFLVKHDFSLLISLDGNEKNNAYRVFKNGEPAYPTIMKNVKILQAKYPGYFQSKVNFNAVLHNKNSVSEIFHFFKEHFNKIPRIGTLNTSGINSDRKEIFWKTYANIEESLYNSEDYSMIEKEMFVKLPTLLNLAIFLHQNNDFSFGNYNELLFQKVKRVKFPTGTCIPFSQKIFVTAAGKILACERIGQQFVLGNVGQNSVTLDYEKIAGNYNEWFGKLEKQCETCYNSEHCIQCIFNLDISSINPICGGFMTYINYTRFLASYLDYLENHPEVYAKIFKEVVIA